MTYSIMYFSCQKKLYENAKKSGKNYEALFRKLGLSQNLVKIIFWCHDLFICITDS